MLTKTLSMHAAGYCTTKPVYPLSVVYQTCLIPMQVFSISHAQFCTGTTESLAWPKPHFLVSDEPLDSSWVYYHDLWHVMHLFKYLHGCKVLTRHTHTHARMHTRTPAHMHTITHTHNHTHTFINTNHKDCKVGEVGTVAGHNTSIHVCCHTTICYPICTCLMHDESG